MGARTSEEVTDRVFVVIGVGRGRAWKLAGRLGAGLFDRDATSSKESPIRAELVGGGESGGEVGGDGNNESLLGGFRKGTLAVPSSEPGNIAGRVTDDLDSAGTDVCCCGLGLLFDQECECRRSAGAATALLCKVVCEVDRYRVLPLLLTGSGKALLEWNCRIKGRGA